MLSFAVVIFAALIGLLALDRVIIWVLPLITPLLPDEFCGPDGWLIDTRQASGIFDRPKR